MYLSTWRTASSLKIFSVPGWCKCQHSRIMCGMAVVVGGDAGIEAARIIREAQGRQVPVMNQRKAAALSGLSVEGWMKILRTGRGKLENVIAMARVVGVEPQVREALGLSPLNGLDGLSEFEKSIFADERLTDQQRRAIVEIYRSPGGWDLLQSLVQDRRGRARRA
jgi:hypothetical protein